MRATLLLLLLALARVTSLGQGTVNFAMPPSTYITVYGRGPAHRANRDDDLVAGLYAGVPTGYLHLTGALAPVGVPVAGVFAGGTRTIPNISPGSAVDFEVRVWSRALRDGTLLTSFEMLMASGAPGLGAGVSRRISLAATGNPTTIPPTPAAALAGLTSFSVYFMPEPSTLTLGMVGGLVVMASRLAFRRPASKGSADHSKNAAA